MEKLSGKKLRNLIGDYLLMTLGLVFYCASWECFMIPNGMSSGGVTGLCTVIQYATGGRLQVSFLYAASNVVLLLLAFAVMGARFGIKTIYCIAMASLLFKLFSLFPQMHSIEGQFLYVPERFLIPALAGLLEGVGLGVIFRNGGSTGGSDILALMVNKFWPVSPGRFFLVTDCVIVLSMLLLPDKTFSDLVYGVIMILISAPVVDAVLIGGRKAVQMMVFSERYDQIADYIIHEMDRGVTAIQAIGWYTKQEKRVLMVVMRQKEVHQVTRTIQELDPSAFISVSPANNVYGEGFEAIKSGLNLNKKKSNDEQ